MLNTRPLARLTRALGAAVLAVGAVAAHAGGGVYWSVNVDTPVHGAGRVGTTFSNSPYGVVGAVPHVVMPAPMHHPRVVYAPPAVVYAPPPHYGHPGHGHGAHGWGWGHRHHHHHHHGGHGDWRGHEERRGHHGH